MEKSVTRRALPNTRESYEQGSLLIKVSTGVRDALVRPQRLTPYELKKSRLPCRDDAAANEKIPRAIDDSCSAARAA